jgi:hypothetical protein
MMRVMRKGAVALSSQARLFVEQRADLARSTRA